MKWQERIKVYDQQYFTQKQPLIKDGAPLWEQNWTLSAEMLVKWFSPEKVLDCGSATGFMVKAFKDLGIDAVGFDLAPFAIIHSFPGTNVLLVDAACEELPFRDNYFDLVIACDFFEHQDDAHLDFVMENIRKVAGKWVFIRQPLVKMFVEESQRGKFILSFNSITHEERLAKIDTIPEIQTPTPDPNCPYHPQERGRDFWIETFARYGFEYITMPEKFYTPDDPTWANSFNTLVFKQKEINDDTIC
jgi:SAM-dependent methyltransferase